MQFICNFNLIREDVDDELTMFIFFWLVGGWCGEVKTSTNLSQVRWEVELGNNTDHFTTCRVWGVGGLLSVLLEEWSKN